MSSAGSAAEPGGAVAYDDAELSALRDGFADAPALVLAVSGGPDSLGMLAAFARWRTVRGAGPALHAASVDHRLRAEAAAECRMVATAADALGVIPAVLTWDGAKPPTGLQEAARAARHRLLADHARRCEAAGVVLAHTLEDQAETVLMRLAAGSGPIGLRAMATSAEREGMRLFRPFLWEPRVRLAATARAAGLTPVEDPSNRDERFARVRARRLAPLLAAEGLSAEKLATLAGRMGLIEEALAAQTAALEAEASRPSVLPGVATYDGAALLSAPLVVVQRLLAAAIAKAGDAAVDERLEAIEALSVEVLTALAMREALKRTLRGALVSVTASGRVVVAREPSREKTPPTK